MQLSAKQLEVLDCAVNDNPKILVCSGAKRAGKTYIMILLFLIHLEKYRGKNYSFIIGGTTQASIRRNILNDMEVILGKELKLNKANAVEIFGNKVYCFDGANADAWKKARGFTSHGALLNEATALHNMFIKEVISRCSGSGARIYMDTNPENPMHTVKTDYIDKSGQRLQNGQLNIQSYHFTLFDNEFLDEEYVESIIASTPTGMFTDRDIYGKWVAAEGVIYKDYNESKHMIESVDDVEFVRYFCGVDWGYEHHGVIVVMAEDVNNNLYVLEEHAHRHQEIDFWVERAREVRERFGSAIPFYCDSARPEHVQRFKREGYNTKNANKAVVSGIEEVAKHMKTGAFFVHKGKTKLFQQEVFTYCWNPTTGEPIKQNDDCMDAIRYAIYTHRKRGKATVLK